MDDTLYTEHGLPLRRLFFSVTRLHHVLLELIREVLFPLRIKIMFYLASNV